MKQDQSPGLLEGGLSGQDSISPPTAITKDYFMVRDGAEFAGIHLLLDLAGARNLDDRDTIEKALRDSADAAGATLLHLHLHQFTPNGISGVAVLAESHISFHSWPDRQFAALDIFMCGNTDPHKATEIIRKAFEPENMTVTEKLRGIDIRDKAGNSAPDS